MGLLCVQTCVYTSICIACMFSFALFLPYVCFVLCLFLFYFIILILNSFLMRLGMYMGMRGGGKVLRGFGGGEATVRI